MRMRDASVRATAGSKPCVGSGPVSWMTRPVRAVDAGASELELGSAVLDDEPSEEPADELLLASLLFVSSDDAALVQLARRASVATPATTQRSLDTAFLILFPL
jgi:hypothetical protein